MSWKHLEALGFTYIESDLARIVRDWCVGDSILCLVEGEFDYVSSEAWTKLRPFPREKVMCGYTSMRG